MVEWLAGDPAAAERELRWGYESLGQMGAAAEVAPVLAALLAQALYAQGRDEEALRFSELSEEAAAPDDLSAHVQWRAGRRRGPGRERRAEGGGGRARRGRPPARRTGFPARDGPAPRPRRPGRPARA